MGWRCGYLALMSGLATGAERVYLHEEGVTLKSMKEDLDVLVRGFQNGKRLGLVIRNEKANPTYTTAFMCALFEEESGGAFDVRQSILGHLQQGGDPSPFDRIQATKLARRGGPADGAARVVDASPVPGRASPDHCGGPGDPHFKVPSRAGIRVEWAAPNSVLVAGRDCPVAGELVRPQKPLASRASPCCRLRPSPSSPGVTPCAP